MDKRNYRIGLTSAIGCAIVWGLLPIYWNSLKPIPSGVIIFYRIVLMAVVCFIACAFQYGPKNVFKPMFESKKSLLTYIIAGIIITINWSIYIWAVNAGQVIQTSMGYFLEPLVVCLFGVVIYKEKINNWKKISVCLAVCGLLVMIIGYKQVPLIAVGLGLSFAIYAAIKKSVSAAPLQSLLYETIFLAPVALGFVCYYENAGVGALTAGSGKFILLMFAGIATAVPLALFSFAASKLPLITVGLTEYISPSISLILGIFLFKEPFDTIQFSAFAIIWIGLIFFTYGEISDNKNKAEE
ncbi:EamA family transporter RarD [Anaerovoracaceae bacterium 41-7]|uniref:EamA family transporter RarD n=1 Tax=Emergencia sp. 1XD21-10 TaxID=2304569 RepID=UPI00137B839F|nr:EamA family transporter RarD [Emergencia sp. 1XD21-10]MCI9476466.1 EamA family transporter RarD [Emergencia sp.]